MLITNTCNATTNANDPQMQYKVIFTNNLWTYERKTLLEYFKNRTNLFRTLEFLANIFQYKNTFELLAIVFKFIFFLCLPLSFYTIEKVPQLI